MAKYKPLTGKNLLASKHSTATRNFFEGSVRSGKTIGTLYDWIDFCINGPDGTFLMTGRTERTVINNLVLTMQEMLGPGLVKINRGNGTVDICGRTVLLVGANNEAARTKVQGLTLSGIYCDEAATLPESYFNMLDTRMSVKGARMWATCNPEGPNHWFKIKWLDKAKLWVDHDGNIIDRRDDYELLDKDDPNRPLDLHRFSFILDDNENLEQDYVDRTKATYSGLFYQRMVLGRWALADGMVYSQFDKNKHVVAHDDMPNMQRVIAFGVDHGTTNATAGILLGIGDDNKLYAMDEWAPPKGLTTGEYAGLLQEWLAERPEPEFIYVDPAAAPFKVELKRSKVGRSRDATNGVLDGVQLVGALISSGNLLISDRCTELLNEIPGYVWDPKQSDKGIDAVIKVNDHFCFVAGTMVETENGPAPIESIQVGDKVWTRQGLRRICGSGITAKNVETVEVQLSNGKTLCGTGNHPVWVQSHGWTRLDALRYGDKLLSWKSALRQSDSTESSTAATPTPRANPTADTSPPASETSSADTSDSTKKCGCKRTGSTPCRPGSTCTTSTTMSTTTALRTWVSSKLASIFGTITGNGRKTQNTAPCSSATWTAPEPQHQSGTAPKLGENGTANTVTTPGLQSQSGNSRANSAGIPTQSKPSGRPGSAPTTARAHGVAKPDSTMSSDAANDAGQPSSSASTAPNDSAPVIVLRTDTSPTRQTVYNLQVDGCPEYFAQGILVHNCDALRYSVASTERLWRRYMPSLITQEEAADAAA